MKKEELAQQIRDASYLTGQFRLRSGQVSSFYWDKYRFESEPRLLSAIADRMKKLLPDSYDKLAGLELGGIPLATSLSLKTGKACLFVRKVAKNYGTRNLIEGNFKEGERIVVVEDVVTTAGQVTRSVRQMRELGLQIEQVVCAIDRQQGGAEHLAQIGCSLFPAFTLQELEVFAPPSADSQSQPV